MDKSPKYYRFFNGETGNVIYFLSCTVDGQDEEQILEAIRQKLAYEKGMSIEKIYYSKTIDYDIEE